MIEEPTKPMAQEAAATGFDINARWVHEFDNHNRPEGDLFQLSANLKF